MAGAFGVTFINGEDCAAGEGELLHAATIRTMARTEALICGLNAGLECQLRLWQGTQGESRDGDATTIAAISLCGRKTVLRAEVARLDLAGGPTNPTLYFLRSDGSTGLTVGTAIFRASDLRAFASFLGLELSTPPWMR